MNPSLCIYKNTVDRFSKVFFLCWELRNKRQSLPGRQSGGRSVGRVPGLLRHGTIRGDAFEAQGEGLKSLLTLVEEKGGFRMGTNVFCVCFSIASVSVWLCFPWYCSIRRLWGTHPLLAWYWLAALPHLSLTCFLSSLSSLPSQRTVWLHTSRPVPF